MLLKDKSEKKKNIADKLLLYWKFSFGLTRPDKFTEQLLPRKRGKVKFLLCKYSVFNLPN